MSKEATVFDISFCGLGDAVTSLWIAEGARAVGHEVLFRRGPHDKAVEVFGHKFTDDTTGGIGFGGPSDTYNTEMATKKKDRLPRPLQWQSHTPFNVQPLRPKAVIPDHAWEWALQISANRKSVDKPLVLMFPFANWATRNWPLTKWTRLSWRLHAKGAAVIASHKNETNLGGFPFYFYGYPTEHIMALMSIADVVIANDSGTAHLAGTLGARTLAIMGPTDPYTVFGHCPEVQTISVSEELVPCVGCHFEYDLGFRAWCDSGCEALNMLGVPLVEAKVWEMLQKTK